MAPAEAGSAAAFDDEEEEETLDLPGCPQCMEALDTLQHYLLNVSYSEHAQTR